MNLFGCCLSGYTPGSWVENVGGTTMSDYNIPKTTTLLLVGPKGSGKSSLINRISRVFEDDKFAPERAQVTNNSHLGDGTRFLQEYMIPRNSTSFCLYDTCGFCDDTEDLEMVKRWMTKGVCHGELGKSVFDDTNLQFNLKWKSRRDIILSYEKRKVNFVIFVVNGLSVLQCLDSNFENTEYIRLVSSIFSSRYMSYKDQKPAIVITHGDLLTLDERSLVRFFLGELFGVHPITQIFEIPDDDEPTTELTIVDLLRYALEHADRNLPCKVRSTFNKGPTVQLRSFWLLLLGLAMFISMFHFHGFHSMKVYPKLVPESNPKMKEFMDVRQQSVPEPSLKMKESLDVRQETVSDPSLKMKKFMKVQENVDEANLEITRSEIIPDMKVLKEAKFKPSEEIKKDNVEMEKLLPKSSLEVKNCLPEIKEIYTKPSLEIKEGFGENEEIISKRRLEIKAARAGWNTEKIRKVKKVRTRRVPEPSMEIDWNKIRHLWYDV
ncbi:uncharacterized protein [Rutidosis leptorrhynchoides]|uniref:uncharacterized protein isoform X2 n=1 Tax=Rutidosis leptorrhynchoides TaxID=125765 RepID=UPI003A9A1777